MRCNEIKRPELLAPAGNLEKLRFAILYGADAVYIGGKQYSLRQAADNFTISEIKEGVSFAHANGVKVYVTVNIFARNEDLKGLKDYLLNLSEVGVDAIIVADTGVFSVAREIIPGVPVHISTQANVTNVAAVRFWKEMGAKRVTLARELSFFEIKQIVQSADIEAEVFVHGAMCIAYSGRCLMSKYLVNREANQGDCAHSCRWRYFLVEEQRPGEYHLVLEDERGTYFFNSKDLCLARHIPDLILGGIDSLKIEGRMKSLYYVAVVTNVYRQVIDSYCANPSEFIFRDEWIDELKKVSHRKYTTGFFMKEAPLFKQGETELAYSSDYEKVYDFVGVVSEYKEKEKFIRVAVRNRISVGEEIEVFGPGGTSNFKLLSMRNVKNGERLDVAHANYAVDIPVEVKLVKNSILRRKVRN